MSITDFNPVAARLQQRSILHSERGIQSYVPNCLQAWEFHTSQADVKCFFGGNQSGKSTAGIIEVGAECEGKHPLQKLGLRKKPPLFWRVVGVDFPNGIEKIMLPLFRRWVTPRELKGGSWGEAYSEKDRLLTYANGSQVEFMSYDQDLDKFGGTQRDGTWFDEEPPRDIYIECQMRHIVPKGRTIMTMTPVKGMTWIYEDLYEPWAMGSKRSIGCWHISQYDNPHLSVEQIEKLQEGLDETEKQIRVYGKFLHRSGLIYTDFHNREPWLYDDNALNNKIIKECPKWVLIDPHPRKPHAVLFGAVSLSGEKWIYDELWQAGDPADIARIIRVKLEGEEPQEFIIDPQAIGFEGEDRGVSMYDDFCAAGIVASLAIKEIDSGVLKVRKHFQWHPTLRPDYKIPYKMEPPAMTDGGPLIHIAKKCVQTRSQLMKYVWADFATSRARDANDQPQKPRKKDDDFADLIRYFCNEEPQYVPIDKPSSAEPSWKRRWGADYSEGDQVFFQKDNGELVAAEDVEDYETDWRDA